MAWARNGTPHTLTGTATTIEITDLTPQKFNVFLNNIISASSNATTVQRFNNNSNSVYAQRRSSNGGADATSTSATSMSIMIPNFLNSGMNDFAISYVCSISGEEKLVIAFSMNNGNTAGAGTAPQRREGVAKFVPSPDADITEFNNIEVSAQNNAAGSNTSALGGDVTGEAILGNNVQSGSRFEATDTRKIYYGASPSVTYETDFSSSTGWTQVGTAMTIDTVTDQRVEFTNLPRNAEHKVYYNLGSAVSDSNWILDFKVNISSSSTSGNGGVWIGLVDSSNEIHTGSVDGLLINFFDNNVGGTEMRMRSVEYNAGALTVSSNSNTLSLSTDYFVRAIRTSATNIDFGIYTDEARTAQVGSTISKTINASTGSLDVVQITSQSVGDVGTVSGIVDDLKVYDGVTSTDLVWTEEV